MKKISASDRKQMPPQKVKLGNLKQHVMDVACEALGINSRTIPPTSSLGHKRPGQQSIAEVSREVGNRQSTGNATKVRTNHYSDSNVKIFTQVSVFKTKAQSINKENRNDVPCSHFPRTPLPAKRRKLVEYSSGSTSTTETESAPETRIYERSFSSPENSPVRKAKVGKWTSTQATSLHSCVKPRIESTPVTGIVARSPHHPWNSLSTCLGNYDSVSSDLSAKSQSISQVDHSVEVLKHEVLPRFRCSTTASPVKKSPLEEKDESAQFQGVEEMRNQTSDQNRGEEGLSFARSESSLRNEILQSNVYDSKAFNSKTTIIVGEIRPDVTEGDIHDIITNTGLEPKEINIVQKDKEGTSSIVAFVDFSTAEEASDWMRVQQGVLEVKGSRASMQYRQHSDYQGTGDSRESMHILIGDVKTLNSSKSIQTKLGDITTTTGGKNIKATNPKLAEVKLSEVGDQVVVDKLCVPDSKHIIKEDTNSCKDTIIDSEHYQCDFPSLKETRDIIDAEIIYEVAYDIVDDLETNSSVLDEDFSVHDVLKNSSISKEDSIRNNQAKEQSIPGNSTIGELRVSENSPMENTGEHKVSGRSPSQEVNVPIISVLEEEIGQLDATSEEQSVPKKKLTRKKRRDPDSWKQNQRKIRRNQGKEYVSESGKTVGPKPITTCLNCRSECTQKVSSHEQIELREAYNNLIDQNAKKSYLCQLVQESESKTGNKQRKVYKYYLSIGNTLVSVCRTFFCGTFGLYSHAISYLFKNNVDAMSLSFTGRKESTNLVRSQRSKQKKDYCKEHINMLPKVESHYRRAESQKEYLETQCRSIRKCYKKFQSWMEEKGVSKEMIAGESIYRQVFTEEFNLSFHKPKNDICHICFLNQTKKTNNALTDEEAIAFKKHLDDKNRARLEKKRDDDNGVHQIHFDLMNTTSLPVTKVGAFFYTSHLTAYNLTAAACIPKLSQSTEVNHPSNDEQLHHRDGIQPHQPVEPAVAGQQQLNGLLQQVHIPDLPTAEPKEVLQDQGEDGLDSAVHPVLGQEIVRPGRVHDTVSHQSEVHAGEDPSINPTIVNNAKSVKSRASSKNPNFDIVGYSATWNESQHGREASDLANGLYQILKSHIDQYKPTDLVLWSDGPTAQNKNSIMTAMLKYLLAETPNLNSITHKFGFANHNFMQKVDSYHSKMERRSKDMEIWSYSDLLELWAQDTKVTDMMKTQHYNFGALAKHEGLYFKNIPYAKVCALRYEKDDAFAVQMKLENFDNPWTRVSIRKLCRQNTRKGDPEEFASFPKPMAVPSVSRKLSKAKIDCLKTYVSFVYGSNKDWLERIIKNCA